MPSGVTDYGTSAWVGALVGALPMPTGYYIALCTDEPGDAMDGSVLSDLEPVDAAYRRQRINNGTGAWGVGDGFATTIVDVGFGVSTVDWGLLTHYALCTAPVGGDVFAWGEFLSPTYIASGYLVSVPAGGVALALTSLDSPIAV